MSPLCRLRHYGHQQTTSSTSPDLFIWGVKDDDIGMKEEGRKRAVNDFQSSMVKQDGKQVAETRWKLPKMNRHQTKKKDESQKTPNLTITLTCFSDVEIARVSELVMSWSIHVYYILTQVPIPKKFHLSFTILIVFQHV